MQSDSSYHKPTNCSSPRSMQLDHNHLLNCRVVERTMVYVTGLPREFLNEDLIKTEQFFGQYGKVSQVVFGESEMNTRHSNRSVFITY